MTLCGTILITYILIVIVWTLCNKSFYYIFIGYYGINSNF